jgi:uncharacterized membrane protein YjjB (DUF3815 family)
MEEFIKYVLDFCMSAVPAVAFAMLFGAPARYLPYIALGGSITHLTRSLCMGYMNFGIVTSTFIASMLISFLFIYIAPKLKVPRPVFTVASIIPIIPGKFAYMTLLSAIKIHNLNYDHDVYIILFFQNGMLTTAVMLAMGLGIALPPLFFYRNRPVV